MSKILPFPLLKTIIIFGFFLLPVEAMEKAERGTKRTHQQAQMYDSVSYAKKPNKSIDNPQLFSTVTRLSTPESHLKCLQQGIKSAKQSILITSYGVDHEAFANGNLYPLLAEASQRGVRVYIYNIASKDTDEITFNFFCKNNIAFDAAYTHAKLFAVDNREVVIGSYSWLSKANTWANASLHLVGEECTELVPLLWEDLKYYRNLQFGNFRQVEEYEDDSENDDADAWKLDEATELCYIHSLNCHRDFIAEIFERAKRKLVICTPFINPKSGYQEDFSKSLLRQTLCKGVHIYFVCRTEDPNLVSFRDYLGTLLESSYLHLLSLSNVHLKTVIMDDTLIAEGSFNWLSASRDQKSDHHNHEVTMVIDGQKSAGLIQNFYASIVGQEIMKLANPLMLPNEPKLSPIKEQKYEKRPPGQVKDTLAIPMPNYTKKPTIDWKVSAKGNTYTTIAKGIIDDEEHHIVIIKGRNHTYSAIIDKIALGKWYATEEEAKVSAFNFLK